MYYKFLRLKGKKIKSNSGDCVWKKGEWKHEDKIDMCNSGFHCSSTILDAFSFVQGEILAQVEVKGKKEVKEDKSVHSDMRLVKIWNWTKKDSVALSIFSAELVIKNFEKIYPNDNRPRLAIEAAKKVLENDTEETRSAAWSAAANAAWSAAASAAASTASAAASTAASTASAAASAVANAVANAASAVANAVANAASAAANAASAVANAVANAASAAANARSGEIINTKINKWLISHLKEMKEYK